MAQILPTPTIGRPTRLASAGPPPPVKIDARNLSFAYGARRAVEDVSMPIYRHRVTSLMGPSGCGKSTLLRIFNRMYELYPDHHVEGEALLDGVNIIGRAIRGDVLRARVGMVFQQPLPFPMSVYDNVAYGVRLYADHPRRRLDEVVESALRRAALWDEVKDNLRKSGTQLSGGQQQRLCIARTLAIDPEVILLDEPCSALDPVATAKIEETIMELKQRHTIVIVTHNLQQAARVSDYVGFMYLGRLIEFGEAEQMFTAPRKPETQRFVTGRFG